jgi:hypothetical protein
VSSISVTNVDQLRGIVGSDLNSKLLIKLEKDSEKLYSLVRELQDLPLPEVEIHLTGFQGMTQTQLSSLDFNSDLLFQLLSILRSFDHSW